MKLDKWPEEIEVDGWRWRKDCLPPFDVLPSCTRGLPSPVGYFYRRIEKLHVPPTMREIMEHLLKGGWVVFGDGDIATRYYYKIEDDGEIWCRLGSVGEGWFRKTGPLDRRLENERLWFLFGGKDE